MVLIIYGNKTHDVIIWTIRQIVTLKKSFMYLKQSFHYLTSNIKIFVHSWVLTKPWKAPINRNSLTLVPHKVELPNSRNCSCLLDPVSMSQLSVLQNVRQIYYFILIKLSLKGIIQWLKWSKYWQQKQSFPQNSLRL